jgi:hypothetical protein
MWPFSKIKKLKLQIDQQEAVIQSLSMGISLDNSMIMAVAWKGLDADEQITKLRYLDMVLTLKKTGRWNYRDNCMKPKVGV